METRVLVQTLETPTETTGSSSEGTGHIWQIFQLGTRPLNPTWTAIFAKPPSIRNPTRR